MNEESITAMELGDSLIIVALYPFVAFAIVVVVYLYCDYRELTRRITVAVAWTLIASFFVVAAMALPQEHLGAPFWLSLVAVCAIDAITLWRLAVHAARRYQASRLVRQQSTS